ncbi:VOC family protein [Nocardia sp. NPDC056100]|uniref:VOC family protein n=1 Tax=Nocardia sp. NPDC056100 TaxID=3345712 RepID=UPI0035DD73C3
MDMKLEVIVLPVADVDRAKAFYADRLGFRLDADFTVDQDYRVVQVTPPGSACSIIFGTGVTAAEPGSVDGLHLIVTDIEQAVADLAERGVAVDGPFRDATGVFHHAGTTARIAGVHPERRSYGSFAAFADPDGNSWFLQEITQRAPGR